VQQENKLKYSGSNAWILENRRTQSTDAEYVSLPSLAWGNNATNIPAWAGGKQLGTAIQKYKKLIYACSFSL